jgi:hypothetical protein
LAPTIARRPSIVHATPPPPTERPTDQRPSLRPSGPKRCSRPPARADEVTHACRLPGANATPPGLPTAIRLRS